MGEGVGAAASGSWAFGLSLPRPLAGGSEGRVSASMRSRALYLALIYEGRESMQHRTGALQFGTG